jgi:hypothetical protein
MWSLSACVGGLFISNFNDNLRPTAIQGLYFVRPNWLDGPYMFPLNFIYLFTLSFPLKASTGIHLK